MSACDTLRKISAHCKLTACEESCFLSSVELLNDYVSWEEVEEPATIRQPEMLNRKAAHKLPPQMQSVAPPLQQTDG